MNVFHEEYYLIPEQLPWNGQFCKDHVYLFSRIEPQYEDITDLIELKYHQKNYAEKAMEEFLVQNKDFIYPF